MSPLIDDLVTAWASALPEREAASLLETIQQIRWAICFAQYAPPTLDRRAIALVITKLEEAEHWALTCLRLAVEREHVVAAERKGVDP